MTFFLIKFSLLFSDDSGLEDEDETAAEENFQFMDVVIADVPPNLPYETEAETQLHINEFVFFSADYDASIFDFKDAQARSDAREIEGTPNSMTFETDAETMLSLEQLVLLADVSSIENSEVPSIIQTQSHAKNEASLERLTIFADFDCFEDAMSVPNTPLAPMTQNPGIFEAETEASLEGFLLFANDFLGGSKEADSFPKMTVDFKTAANKDSKESDFESPVSNQSYDSITPVRKKPDAANLKPKKFAAMRFTEN